MLKKYIFVTGGVVSGIGKGICAASIGNILKASGLNVDAQKLDPYLNVDPGTMSPYEHGEVYVLSDGKETDLDLGNYERFLNTNLNSDSSISSGIIYSEIIQKEREGGFLGKTVQIIPHVTNLIKDKFKKIQDNCEIKIVEIGGSTGDIEAQVYLESLRQFKVENKSDVLHIHLGYIPFLKAVGEYKSKPIQNSIKELQGLGLQPDILVLRYEVNENDLSDLLIEKIALYSNLEVDSIVKIPDLKSIYESPKHLVNNTSIVKCLNNFVGKKLNVELSEFFENPSKCFNETIKIALIAKYSGISDSYLSVIESVKIAGIANQVNTMVSIIDSENPMLFEIMKEYDGFIVPGGFGKRGLEEKIKAIQWIRENKKPFLGICLGMQMAVVEYARNVCKLKNLTSREIDENEKENCIIDYMPEQMSIQLMGGTMRLGSYECLLDKNSLAYNLYKKETIIERHRHRLEVQNKFVPKLEENGLRISGKFIKNNDYLVELVELDKKTHPFFIATQAHPEFLSRPDKAHPLFLGLINAAKKLNSLK
ncbi:MAG: CTP synthase [Patescibacteria group bacterium]